MAVFWASASLLFLILALSQWASLLPSHLECRPWNMVLNAFHLLSDSSAHSHGRENHDTHMTLKLDGLKPKLALPISVPNGLPPHNMVSWQVYLCAQMGSHLLRSLALVIKKSSILSPLVGKWCIYAKWQAVWLESLRITNSRLPVTSQMVIPCLSQWH
jgi:hypothetical protein